MGQRPFAFSDDVKGDSNDEKITSILATLLVLVHLMSEPGCVGLQVTVHVCLSCRLTSDCLSHLNVGHRRLDQLETTFSERSAQLRSAVLEPDLRGRQGVTGCR